MSCCGETEQRTDSLVPCQSLTAGVSKLVDRHETLDFLLTVSVFLTLATPPTCLLRPTPATAQAISHMPYPKEGWIRVPSFQTLLVN